MAAIKMLDELSDTELEIWKTEYDSILTETYDYDSDKIAELNWMYLQLQNRISPILWGSLGE